jgi:nitrous oxidase accessory protein
MIVVLVRATLVVGLVLVVTALPTQAKPARSTDLQALIDATPAGGLLRLEAGTYGGDVVVDQPITISGAGAVIDGGGEGTVITVSAEGVTLEGLTIRNSGAVLEHEDAGVRVDAGQFTLRDSTLEDVLFGAYLTGAPQSRIVGNVVRSKPLPLTVRGDGIHVYQSSGTVVEDNDVSDGRDIIAFFSDDVVVRNNVVANGRYGLHLMYADGALVEGNRIWHNLTGLYVMYSKEVTVRDSVLAYSDGPSGYGLTAKESDLIEVEGNRMVANRVGIFLDGSPFRSDLTTVYEGNVVAYNSIGVLMQPAVRNNAFGSNSFIDNREQVSTTSGGVLEGNEWSIDERGNHWSDYAGYDAAGDGIGDSPYRAESLYDAVTDEHPQLTFFADTPAAQALDAAARAFPALRPEPKAVDEHPLIRAPKMAPVVGAPPQGSSAGLALASAAMVALAVAVLAAGRRRPGAGVPS